MPNRVSTAPHADPHPEPAAGAGAPRTASAEDGGHNRWIELIRVRSFGADLDAALPVIERRIAEVEGADAMVMRHALYDGDLAVVLVWATEVVPDKTRDGLMLAEQLARVGTIVHAVWVPATGLARKTTTQPHERKARQ